MEPKTPTSATYQASVEDLHNSSEDTMRGLSGMHDLVMHVTLNACGQTTIRQWGLLIM